MAKNEFLSVQHDKGTLRFFGDLRLSTLNHLLSAVHQTVNIARYPDICLDFSDVSSLTYSVIPPLAAYLRSLTRDAKVEFALVTPRAARVRNQMIDWGLAHYVEHRRFDKPRLNSSSPGLLQFLDHSEREFAIDKVLNSALRTAKLNREHVAALEWAVNEITDNVITHSGSKVGGFLVSHRLPPYKYH